MDIDQLEDRLDAAVRNRLKLTGPMRQATLAAVSSNLLQAEPNRSRRLAATERSVANILAGAHAAEARKGPRSNFIPVSFLEAGALAARSVARVSMFRGARTGTGFLISPDLFMTNHHVLPTPEHADAAVIEFEFEADLHGRSRPETTFRLDPDQCFAFSHVDLLDYTVVGIGERLAGERRLEEFGYNPLSASSSKHSIGEYANIIQHPDGRAKEVVLQDNLIAARHEIALHYLADTEPGSSGSPVFNNRWQVIALHHWGEIKEPNPEVDKVIPDAVNEGIRISRIVHDLGEQVSVLSSSARELVSDALYRGESGSDRGNLDRGDERAASTGPVSRANADGTVTWQVPVEITLGIGGTASGPIGHRGDASPPRNRFVKAPARPFGPEARTLNELVVSNGYDPDFLVGFSIPLPDIDPDLATELFPQFQRSERPSYELTYTNFSVVMNKARKMAMLTACNIDGPSLFGLTRKTGEKYLYSAKPTAINARLAEAAEASSWFFDNRIPRSDQTGAPFYDKRANNTLITPDDQNFAPVLNFSRGHIVRRLDPVWGTLEEGLAADADSHGWPNVAPQTPRFNANNRDKADVSSGEEKRLWAALENTILREAHNDKQRITVFGGPILSDDDPVYAGLPDGEYRRQVPLEFWKVACWIGEDGELKALALRVNQRKTMLATGAEALDSTSSFLALNDFLTTIAKLEDDLGFKFPDVVRQADIRRGRQGEEVAAMSQREMIERLGIA